MYIRFKTTLLDLQRELHGNAKASDEALDYGDEHRAEFGLGPRSAVLSAFKHNNTRNSQHGELSPRPEDDAKTEQKVLADGRAGVGAAGDLSRVSENAVVQADSSTVLGTPDSSATAAFAAGASPSATIKTVSPASSSSPVQATSVLAPVLVA